MPEKTAAKRTWMTPQAQQTRVKLITIAIIAGACMGPLALLLSFTRSAPPTAEIPPTPIYVSQATAVVTSWIEGRPSPIPTNESIPAGLGRQQGSDRLPITNLAWSTFTREAGFTDPSYFVELHTFTGVIDKKIVIIEVAIATQGNGPVLVSLPSIVPSRILPGTQKIPFTLESYGESATLTGGGRDQLSQWAKAYGENNQEALYRLTGDPEQNTYQGIPGGNYILTAEPNIIISVIPNDPTTLEPQSNRIIARISVTYAKPYTQQEVDAATAASGNGGFARITAGEPNPQTSMTLQFDVLITETERTLPFISSWGAVGTGPLLAPYDNAVLFAPTQTGSATTTTIATATTTTVAEAPATNETES